MVRLRRQSQKDLSCLRRAQRALQSREDKVTICEKMINRQQQTFVRLESRLQKDMSSFEQNEIQAVMRHLVDEVELSARAAKFCGAQVDLAWYSIMEQDRLDCTATLDKELREAEDFIAVEKQLYDKQVKSLEVELKATCECLQDEKRAATNLKASFDFLQQDLTCKTEWLTALTAGSMSLVRTQNQITTAVEAERAEWQSSTNQLKELNERLQGEHAKQLDVFQAENAQLQEQLRVSELNETNCQQLLRHAEMNAKTATAQHKKIRREFKTLQDRFKSLQEERTLLQQETAPPPLHVPISANLLKANPARLLTLRNKGFVGKRTRD
ncbi:hypothetical protein PHMEG_00026740 [Phytophthora megakarya]|uniref:Uncharacterized protein n=1 Tax=Phytophthora megakarya TaxID=4795 RepID=A0A225VAJ5_9STRA|nr:hypothetical protein PHMEG_00026740 [Phytophthora megakarya]